MPQHFGACAGQVGFALAPVSLCRKGDLVCSALVIIPTYNEYDNILPLISGVLASDPYLDVLVVDDNSPDGTGQRADMLAAETERVRVLHRPGKQGLGTAYLAGFEYALARDYERVVEMDADFSHRPEDLPRLLQASRTADIAIGSRRVPGGRIENWSMMRHLVSGGGSLYAQAVLGLPIKDCTSGFKCLSRKALMLLEGHNIATSGYGFHIEVNWICHLAGLCIVEVPIVFPDRETGQSKITAGIVLEAALLVWRLRAQQLAMPRAQYGARLPSSVNHLVQVIGEAGDGEGPSASAG